MSVRVHSPPLPPLKQEKHYFINLLEAGFLSSIIKAFIFIGVRIVLLVCG
ncbi:hypothetical protein XNW1_4760022 [Xenorhabdus nematophila str. Websteri]|nr:hypothetical protein XNW1_4760022 [Xenorhabdus nematophila str. Websteri]